GNTGLARIRLDLEDPGNHANAADLLVDGVINPIPDLLAPIGCQLVLSRVCHARGLPFSRPPSRTGDLLRSRDARIAAKGWVLSAAAGDPVFGLSAGVPPPTRCQPAWVSSRDQEDRESKLPAYYIRQ